MQWKPQQDKLWIIWPTVLYVHQHCTALSQFFAEFPEFQNFHHADDDYDDDDDDDDDDQDLNGHDDDEDDSDTVAVPGWSSTSWESRSESRRWTSSPTCPH